MLADSDAMSEYVPDYIILDEFHRCGAEMWGKAWTGFYPHILKFQF